MEIINYVAWGITVMYVLQAIITLMGTDSSDGLNADFGGDLSGNLPGDNMNTFNGDHASMQFFSLKNLLGFLLGFFWGYIIFIGYDVNVVLSVCFSLILGTVVVLLQMSLMVLMMKLEQKNVPSMNDAMGKYATVYLTIRANGLGKVTVLVDGVKKVVNATASEDILTGEYVKVIGVDSNVLTVEKKKV